MAKCKVKVGDIIQGKKILEIVPYVDNLGKTQFKCKVECLNCHRVYEQTRLSALKRSTDGICNACRSSNKENINAIEPHIYSAPNDRISLRFSYRFGGKDRGLTKYFSKDEIEEARILKYKVLRLPKVYLETNSSEDFEEYLHKVFDILYADVNKLHSLENEEWREVPGLESTHLVSNLGRLCRIRKHDIFNEYVMLSGSIWQDSNCKSKTPYLQDSLCFNGKRTVHTRRHRIVAMAFIPNPNNLPEVNHIDGNGLNNCVDNLEWVTSHENAVHAREVLKRAMGGKCGEEHASAKLTWDIVREIREKYSSDKNALYSTLAREYNIARSTIESIIKNQAWVDENYTPPTNSNYWNNRGYSSKPQKTRKPNMLNIKPRLTFAQAEEIREKYFGSIISQKVLAKEYGVTRSLISAVVNRKGGYAKTERDELDERVLVYKDKIYNTIEALLVDINRKRPFVTKRINKRAKLINNQIVIPDDCFD